MTTGIAIKPEPVSRGSLTEVRRAGVSEGESARSAGSRSDVECAQSPGSRADGAARGDRVLLGLCTLSLLWYLLRSDAVGAFCAEITRLISRF